MLSKFAGALVFLSGLLLPPIIGADANPTAIGKADPNPAVVEIATSPADEKQFAGLETWNWTGHGSDNGVNVTHAAIKTQPQNTVLVVDYLGGRTEKATAKCVTDLALDPQGRLSVRVFCTEKDPPKVAFAISTGETFTWQESESALLKEGWNELVVKLGDKHWKSEATKWKHVAEAKDLDDVRAILFLVFNGKHGGLLYLDALHVDRDPKLDQELTDLTKSIGAEDFETRESASKRLVEMGRKAIPYLRNAAASTDPEVAQRARKVMELIEGRAHVEASNEDHNSNAAHVDLKVKVRKLKPSIEAAAEMEMLTPVKVEAVDEKEEADKRP